MSNYRYTIILQPDQEEGGTCVTGLYNTGRDYR